MTIVVDSAAAEIQEKRDRVAAANQSKINEVRSFLIGTTVKDIQFGKIILTDGLDDFVVSIAKEETNCGECWEATYYDPHLAVGQTEIPNSILE